MTELTDLGALRGVVQKIDRFVRESGDALRAQPARTALAVLAARDEPGAFQHLQMLRHRRQAHGEGAGDLLHGHVAFAGQPAEDRQPSRIAQGREGVAKRLNRLHV